MPHVDTPFSSPTSRRAFLRRGGAGAAMLLGVGPLLAACGSDSSGDSSGGGGTTDVAISLPTGGNSLSIWKPISERLKLDVPDAKLKWVGGDPGQLQTQFLAGSVDISTFGPLGTALSLLKGESIEIVGPGIYGHHKWLVADSSPARSVRDLRGKKIATGLSTSEAFRATQLIVAMQGGDANADFEWIFAKGASANALFERGDADAIYVGEPNATVLISQGARQVGSVQDEWRSASGSDEPLFNAGPTVRTKWVTDHPAAARDTVAMLVKASTSVAGDPSQLEQVASAIGVKPADRKAIAQLPTRMADVYMKEFGPAQRKQLDDVVALGVKHGVLPRAPAKKTYADLPATT